MIGMTLGSLMLFPLTMWIFIVVAMGGDSGGTPLLGLLTILSIALIGSTIVGPLAAWICWLGWRRPWTWWWITLPFQILTAMVVVFFIMVAH